MPQIASNPSVATQKLNLPNPTAVRLAPPTQLLETFTLPSDEASGVKRTAATAGLTSPAPDISSMIKQKKIAWCESQVKKDQNEAINCNYKTPFKSQEDACKRLLRFHVFNELDASPWQMQQANEAFEKRAEGLLSRYHSMLNKYQYLLLQESKVSCKSSFSQFFLSILQTTLQNFLAC